VKVARPDHGFSSPVGNVEKHSGLKRIPVSATQAAFGDAFDYYNFERP
jgi:hypothetical protein